MEIDETLTAAEQRAQATLQQVDEFGIEQMTKTMCRHLLFKRGLVKREELAGLLGEHSRAFPYILHKVADQMALLGLVVQTTPKGLLIVADEPLVYGKNDPRYNAATVLLSLIFLAEQDMEQRVLDAYLTNLGINETSGALGCTSTGLVQYMLKQGIIIDPGLLERAKRQTSDGMDWHYSWGARAIAEFPGDSIVDFVCSAFTDYSQDRLELLKTDIKRHQL